jgi:Protein of unknown function (DUF4019)
VKSSIQSTISIFFCIIFLIICSFATASEQNKGGDEAIKGANVFLQIVDDGQYGASWEKTAPLFKRQVSQEKWAEMLSRVRPHFGAMISRSVKAAKFTTSLPGAPDGEYVTIQFASSFEQKAEAIETLTMARVEGAWQIAGYFIK